jgi:hypothetical protein
MGCMCTFHIEARAWQILPTDFDQFYPRPENIGV